MNVPAEFEGETREYMRAIPSDGFDLVTRDVPVMACCLE